MIQKIGSNHVDDKTEDTEHSNNDSMDVENNSSVGDSKKQEEIAECKQQ